MPHSFANVRDNALKLTLSPVPASGSGQRTKGKAAAVGGWRSVKARPAEG
jgi:hypothetical protein